MPDHLADLLERPERYETMANDAAALTAYVLAHARAAQNGDAG